MRHLTKTPSFIASLSTANLPLLLRRQPHSTTTTMTTGSPERPRRSKRLRRAAPPPPASPSSQSSQPDAASDADSDFSPITPPSSAPPSPSVSPSPRPSRRLRPPQSPCHSLTPLAAPARVSFSPTERNRLRKSLLDWYIANHRQFPWRAAPTPINPTSPPYPPLTPSSPGAPYAVWISEVMSQQTRISVVIGYYTRWMAAFPNVAALSAAPLDSVNTLWAGLGYYRRARHLHEAARQIVTQHAGIIPSDVRTLRRIPGIGRYTAGAIASIAYKVRTPAVDGNVERVLSRLLPALTAPAPEPPALPAAYWQIAEALVADAEAPGDLNQALMELGGTVCKPKAVRCGICPLREQCGAHAEALACGVPDPAEYVVRYPLKHPRKATKVREETVAVLVACVETDQGRRFLLQQRPGGGLLAGLWEAPNVVVEAGAEAGMAEAMESLQRSLPQVLSTCVGMKRNASSEDYGTPDLCVEVGTVMHIFSHIRQTLNVRLVIFRSRSEIAAPFPSGTTTESVPFRWLSEDELGAAAVSTQMKKVFAAAYKKLPKAKRIRR